MFVLWENIAHQCFGPIGVLGSFFLYTEFSHIILSCYLRCMEVIRQILEQGAEEYMWCLLVSVSFSVFSVSWYTPLHVCMCACVYVCVCVCAPARTIVELKCIM